MRPLSAPPDAGSVIPRAGSQNAPGHAAGGATPPPAPQGVWQVVGSGSGRGGRQMAPRMSPWHGSMGGPHSPSHSTGGPHSLPSQPIGPPHPSASPPPGRPPH